MREILLIVFMLFLFLNTYSQMGSPPRAGSLYFKETFVDLGELKEGEVANHLFEFESISNDTIEIDVLTTCGCVAPISEKKIIAPGERGKIGFYFHSQGRSGPADKCLYVDVKDKLRERYILCFKANVIPQKP